MKDFKAFHCIKTCRYLLLQATFWLVPADRHDELWDGCDCVCCTTILLRSELNCAEICKSRFLDTSEIFICINMWPTPLNSCHTYILFVSRKNSSGLSSGFVQFVIKLLVLAAHFLLCSYIYANLHVVPTQFWPCMFDLHFPVFPSLVMCL